MSRTMKIVYVLLGVCICIPCGVLIYIAAELANPKPYRDFGAFLTFLVHPVAFLFLAGVWFIFKGLLTHVE
jgi:hypothetical protein